MEIIKEGYLPPKKKKKYNIFECKKCGCIFIATENEYTYNFVYDVSIIKCPCCNILVETKGPGTEDKFDIL